MTAYPVFGLYPDYVSEAKVDWTEEGKNKLIRGPLRRTGIITLYYQATAVLPTVETG